jgi:hypothetical protein
LVSVRAIAVGALSGIRKHEIGDGRVARPIEEVRVSDDRTKSSATV